MAGKSANQLQNDAQLQEQVDGVQRGPHLGEVFDASSETFSLNRITADISTDVRQEVLSVLREQPANTDNLQSLKTEYGKRVRANNVAVTDTARKQEIGLEVAHDFLDDALMDVRVLNKLLADKDNKKIVDLLNQALKEDVPPIDIKKRPDSLIFLRALFFSVEGNRNLISSDPPGYAKSIKAAQEALIIETASLPDTPAMETLKGEIATHKKESADRKKLKENLGEDKLGAAIDKISDSEDALRTLYDEISGISIDVTKERDTKSTIAKCESQIKTLSTRLGQKGLSEPDRGRISGELDTANENLVKEQFHLKQIELLKQRPEKEKAHRRLLKDLMDKVDVACKATGEPKKGADTGIATGLGAPDKVNIPDFDGVYTLLKTNLHPKKRANDVNAEDATLLVYSDQLYQWLQSKSTTPPATDSILNTLEQKLGKQAEDLDVKTEEAEGKLTKLKAQQGKATSFSDHEFNVQFLVNLAKKENPALAAMEEKKLEEAVRMNLINDVLDLKQKGRVGRSFDAKKRGILESIDPTHLARFQKLQGVAYYDKSTDKLVKPLATYNLHTTDYNELFKKIDSGDLTPGGAITLYASLSVADLADHPNAQLLRRTIISDLVDKGQSESDAAANFQLYVDQASEELLRAEKKNPKNSKTAKVVDFAANNQEKAAKRAKRMAGEITLTEHLEEKAKEKGELTAWDVAGGMMSQGALRAAPSVLGAGRDGTIYVAKNTFNVGTGLALSSLKFAGGLITTLPGLTLRTLGDNLPDLIRPHRIIGRAISTSVSGVFHPFQTLRKLSGRTGEGQKLIDVKYQAWKKGTDLTEKAKERAQIRSKRAEQLRHVHQGYYHMMDHHYDWMDMEWGKKPAQSNVIPLKAKDEPKKEGKKADNGNGTGDAAPMAAAA